MKSIEVNIENDKINDLEYIQSKLLNVCLQTLYDLTEHTDKSFNNLAKEFLPVEEDRKQEIIKDFLSKIKSDIPSKIPNKIPGKKRTIKKRKKGGKTIERV